MNKKMYYWIRFFQFSGLLAVAVFIFLQLNELRTISNDIRYQQTEKFSDSLTNLAAAEASRYLAQNKQQDLQILIDDLSTDDMVRDATIYDNLGKVLFQSNEALQLPVLLKITSDSDQQVQGIIPYIAELYNDDEDKIGYIRISLRQAHILRLIFDYQEQTLQALISLLILSFVAGTIIMALFFKRLEAWYYRLNNLIPRLIMSNKTP